jgi:outer membrane immunogenic protein
MLAGVSAIALTAAANAADLVPAPAGVGFKDAPYTGVTWNGLYLGVNGGYAWDASSIGSKLGSPLDISPEGGFGGGQIGYNVQRGNIVFGVEADFQGADVTDSKSLGIGPATLEFKSNLDWFGTVRGRLGYAFDSTLVYATGGFAYGHITDENNFIAPNPCPIAPPGRCIPSSSQKFETDASGYVLGGGVEHKFNPSWSVKAEYQYIDLGQNSHWATLTKEDYAINTVRVGLNYHIGGSFEPLK